MSFGVLDMNTRKDLRMTNKVTAVSKYSNISLVNCNYLNYTNPLIIQHCHSIIILPSGLQSLCYSISTIQMAVLINLHLVYLLLE